MFVENIHCISTVQGAVLVLALVMHVYIGGITKIVFIQLNFRTGFDTTVVAVKLYYPICNYGTSKEFFQ